MKILKIYYDGGCYFCKKYTEFIKLKKSFDRVELISLRENTEILKKFQSMGLKYNLGMVVEYEDKFYFGEKAFSFLNIESNNGNIFSKLSKLISHNIILNKIIYNALVVFRYLFLFVQFKTIIFNSKISYNRPELIIFRISIFSVILCNYFFIFKLFNDSSIIENFLLLCGTSLLIFIFVHLIFFKSLNKKIWNFLEMLSGKSLVLYLIFIHLFIHISTKSQTEFVGLRRMTFFIFLFPIFYYFFNQLKKSYKDKKKYIFIFLISAILISAPGIYIVPYYNGIAGWNPKVTSYNFSEYYIVNNKNEKIVYNHLLLQPNTMRGRFQKAYYISYKKLNPKVKTEKIHRNYMKFLYENYVRNYSKIAKGKFPHQKIFGSFSYNGHTLGDNNAKDYKEFAPENIVSIETIKFKFDENGNFINSETERFIKINNKN